MNNIESLEGEIWRKVPGWEDYEVSNLGRVVSYKHNNPKLMAQMINKHGYYRMALAKDNVKTMICVHQIVAITFLGYERPGSTKGLVIDHINSNKLDNRVENLRVVTSRENCQKDRPGNNEVVGVYFSKNKYQSHIFFKGKQISLGCFNTSDDAKFAYEKAVSQVNEGLDLFKLYPRKQALYENKGVSFNKTKNKWVAQKKSNGRLIFLGYCDTEEEALKLRMDADDKLNEGYNLSELKPKRINKNKYEGVYFHTQSQKFRADVRLNGKRKCLGNFKSEEEAYNFRKQYLEQWDK